MPIYEIFKTLVWCCLPYRIKFQIKLENYLAKQQRDYKPILIKSIDRK